MKYSRHCCEQRDISDVAKEEKIIAFHSNENEIESNVLGQKVQSFVYVQGSICNIKP